MRLSRAAILRYFAVFTGRVTKSQIFHPAIAGSTSASHYAAGPRKTTPGPSPGPGASKTSPGRQQMLQNTEKQPNTPLSLGLHNSWLPGGSGGLPRLDEYEHWVCYGAGGWPTPIYIWGTWWDRFWIVLGLCWNHVLIVLGLFYNSFGTILKSFWNRLGILKNHPGGLEML